LQQDPQPQSVLALHESFTIPVQYIMDRASRHMHSFTATNREFSTLTSVCEHVCTCLQVSTETCQLIWKCHLSTLTSTHARYMKHAP
jgi:hypothetical protein